MKIRHLLYSSYLKLCIELLKEQRNLKTVVYLASGEKYETLQNKHSSLFIFSHF